jgi:ketosteroid isomerase-like protein
LILSIVLALTLAGCQTATSTQEQEEVPAPDSAPAPVPAAADPERDHDAVVAAHRALIGAYEAGDVDAFVRGLDPSAELLVFHPQQRSRFEGIDEVRRELGPMFARMRGSSWSDHHALVTVEGDVAWLTAHVLIESTALESPFAGRGTEIFVRRTDGWKLIHGHWSMSPES